MPKTTKQKTAKKATPSRTLVTFLLDRSGSMGSCKAATIEGFNAYVGSLKTEQETVIDFTFLTFDTGSLDKIYVAEPIANVALLTNESYQPRGGTPLIDASVKTINATDAALKQRDSNTRVVVCIQTDGYENASAEHTWEELQALIAAKTAAGWEFLFMGAGIDAYAQGARMGIGALNTMSYDHTRRETTVAAFAASARNSADFGAARAMSTSYSAGQRLAAGDRFDPDLNGQGLGAGDVNHLTRRGKTTVMRPRRNGGSPLAGALVGEPRPPLDLTPGSAAPIPTSPAPLDLSSPIPPRVRGKTVPDFSL